jgi:ABC-2 type transport system permease protein
MFLMGLAYGGIGDDVKALVGDSDYSQQVFGQGGGSIVDSFYAASALLLALTAAGFSISSALHVRGEETGGHAESLLATALPRWRWAAAQLAVTIAGSIVVVGAAGLGLGVGYALVTGDGSAVVRLSSATVPYVVPVLVLVGLTWLVYGLLPRRASVGWLLLTFCVVVMLFGEVLRFPQWIIDVSPFSHLALVPAQTFAWSPVLWLIATTVVLLGAGMAALRHRDLT